MYVNVQKSDFNFNYRLSGYNEFRMSYSLKFLLILDMIKLELSMCSGIVLYTYYGFEIVIHTTIF